MFTPENYIRYRLKTERSSNPPSTGRHYRGSHSPARVSLFLTHLYLGFISVSVKDSCDLAALLLCCVCMFVSVCELNTSEKLSFAKPNVK